MKKLFILCCTAALLPCMAKPLFEMSNDKAVNLQLTSGVDTIGSRLFMQNKGPE